MNVQYVRMENIGIQTMDRVKIVQRVLPVKMGLRKNVRKEKIQGQMPANVFLVILDNILMVQSVLNAEQGRTQMVGL